MLGSWVGTVSGMALLGFAGIVAAQSTSSQTPIVDTRQQIQQERIEKGVESGALIPPEAHRLNARQAKIDADKQKTLADGTVTQQERARLTREQNRVSRRITRQKYDRQISAPSK